MLFHLKYNGCQKHVLQEKNRRFTDYIYFLKIFQISNIRTKFKYVFFWGGGGNSLTVRKAIAICRLLPKSH